VVPAGPLLDGEGGACRPRHRTAGDVERAAVEGETGHEHRRVRNLDPRAVLENKHAAVGDLAPLGAAVALIDLSVAEGEGGRSGKAAADADLGHRLPGRG